MDKNEIKKALYKQGGTAVLDHVRKDGMFYTAFFHGEDGLPKPGPKVNFLIPLEEIGEVIWERQIDAKLLIRWLQ